jgi:hypothetical protein
VKLSPAIAKKKFNEATCGNVPLRVEYTILGETPHSEGPFEREVLGITYDFKTNFGISCKRSNCKLTFVFESSF